MKLSWLAIGTFLAGLGIGVWIAPYDLSATIRASGKSGGPATNIRKTGSGGAQASQPKSADDSARKAHEPRVSIPLAKLAPVLKSDLKRVLRVGLGRVEFSGREVANALDLLNASDEEKEQVKAIVDRTNDQLWEAEKKSIKVVKAGPEDVKLSVAGFHAESKPVLEQARQELLFAMPDARGQALADAIPWDQSVFNRFGGTNADDSEAIISFEIVRSKGGLVAWTHAGSGGAGGGLSGSEYPDDGTPIPADKVFESTWKPWLTGVTLLPVDEH